MRNYELLFWVGYLFVTGVVFIFFGLHVDVYVLVFLLNFLNYWSKKLKDKGLIIKPFFS